MVYTLIISQEDKFLKCYLYNVGKFIALSVRGNVVVKYADDTQPALFDVATRSDFLSSARQINTRGYIFSRLNREF